MLDKTSVLIGTVLLILGVISCHLCISNGFSQTPLDNSGHGKPSGLELDEVEETNGNRSRDKDYHHRVTIDEGRLEASSYRAHPDSVARMHAVESVSDCRLSVVRGETIYAETVLVSGMKRTACWGKGEYGVWVERYPTAKATKPQRALFVYRQESGKLVAILQIKSDGTFSTSPGVELLKQVKEFRPEMNITEAENIPALPENSSQQE